MPKEGITGRLKKKPTLADLIALEKVAAAAGRVACDLFERRNEFLVEEKSPGQFVTDADRKIEQLIRRNLKASFGKHPVIGEEYGGSFQGGGWVIDPIDGTSNFLCGIPLWSISIAYMSNNVPVLGAVYAPQIDLLVSALAGGRLRYNRKPFVRRAKGAIVPTFSIGENDSWCVKDVRQTIDGLRKSGYDIVRLRSASLSLAMSCIGMIDGFVEERLKVWDIAAGWLICEQAGLPVTVAEHEGFSRSIWAGVISL